MKIRLNLIIAVLIAGSLNVSSQVNVINTQLTGYNVSPASLSHVNITSGLSQTMEVLLHGELVNEAGEMIMEFNSFPFKISPGFNSYQTLRISLSNSQYGFGEQAKYVKNRRLLPSGTFKYCYSLTTLSGSEPLEDNCEEIESQVSDFLTLIYPGDEEVIQTKNPVLTWSHSEPFNVLGPNEHFALTLVHIDEGQSASEAIANNPIFLKKSELTSHQVPYPFNAKELIEGESYAWRVDRVSNGAIVNQTDIWSFSIQKIEKPEPKKYAVMKPKSEAKFLHLNSNLLYFTFNEDYHASNKTLKYKILDDNSNVISGEAVTDNDIATNMKKTGRNQFVLDFSGAGLKRGMYTLVTYDEKGNDFYLKFYFNE
ncbi:MAG: hypothetical protein MRY83_07685 [Flavobacteriales bacterium]|nr:hypothetical protein [Flavobacteriales bacterium]